MTPLGFCYQACIAVFMIVALLSFAQHTITLAFCPGEARTVFCVPR